MPTLLSDTLPALRFSLLQLEVPLIVFMMLQECSARRAAEVRSYKLMDTRRCLQHKTLSR
jgi:hypothetical protein